MSSQVEMFARRVLQGFLDAGLTTDEEVRAAHGPSTSTMTKLRAAAEKGYQMPEPRGDTYRNIDRAAGWRSGSARALWRTGDQPQVMDPPGPRRVYTNPAGGIEGYVEHLDSRFSTTSRRLLALG